MNVPKQEQIIQACKRIQKLIHKTPILHSIAIDSLAGCQVLFKCQNLQKTGSFKVRGAANKILTLQNPESKILCTHSSGNHAQAVAYVASKLKIRSVIIMPSDTPDNKKNAVKEYGAQVRQSGPTVKEQQEMSSKAQKQLNGEFIHPYNDIKVITGAASVAYQIYKQIKDIDYIVFPIGGGGLTSGTVLSTKYFSPNTKAIGVQTDLAKDGYLSFKSGRLHPQFSTLSLAEGIRTGMGSITFDIMKECIDDVILVTQDQMIQAAKVFVQRMKIVVQLTGAIVLAAIIKDPRFKGKKVAAIISGGNININPFFQKIRGSL